jgi:signal transduction histidine kinase
MDRTAGAYPNLNKLPVVTAREEERRRLRRDLHDGPRAALGRIVLQLGGAKTCLSGNRPRPLHYWTSFRPAGSRLVRRGQ